MMQRSSTRRLAYALALVACAGCRSKGPSAEQSIYLDPSGAAAVALELYDANGDQLLDAAELEKCPPLAKAFAAFDVNGDGKLASDEIVGRLMRITMSGASLTDASCTVLLAGRPLADAKVRLEPVFVKGEATWAGEGVTNAQGVAKISLPADKLPGGSLRRNACRILPRRDYASATTACGALQHGLGTRLGNRIQFRDRRVRSVRSQVELSGQSSSTPTRRGAQEV